jgi:hypothetical protein
MSVLKNLKETDRFGDMGMYGKIILKLTLNVFSVRTDHLVTVAGFCGKINGISVLRYYYFYYWYYGIIRVY